jgi:hypothetical protein
MTLVCDVWLARDFLRRTRRPLDIPPCTCPADLCPPIRERNTDMSTTPTDHDRWHELTEILTNSEAEYRTMAAQTFADSHDPMNAFRWQQRAEGLHIALAHVRRIGGQR